MCLLLFASSASWLLTLQQVQGTPSYQFTEVGADSVGCFTLMSEVPRPSLCGVTISGHQLSRLRLLSTQHHQTRGFSYYMKGKHERAVGNG